MYLVPDEHWYLMQSPYHTTVAAMHGTPWKYDRYVPIVFFGRGVKPGVYGREVAPRDIAPTLAAMVGIEAPRQAEGSVLVELKQ